MLTIEYDTDPPTLSRGRSVQLEELRLTGLRDGSAKDEQGRRFDCPNCGAPVSVKLATTQSITYPSCRSIIDLSHGIGAELAHAEQHEPVRPAIALGSVGRLQGAQWQVVGFQYRLGKAPGDDESFGWSEYLLFNQKRGFSFLVDSQEGWSLLHPATGAPRMSRSGASYAKYLGVTYWLKDSYEAETQYVAGEFYWPVARGQKTFNRDFANETRLLTLEQTPTELTWSVGGMIASALVQQAFGIAPDSAAALRKSDAGPLSAAPKIGCGTLIAVLVLLLILSVLLSRCSDDSGSGGGYRSSGGSYGGYSSGGGHK